jgi:hypothetical protein
MAAIREKREIGILSPYFVPLFPCPLISPDAFHAGISEAAPVRNTARISLIVVLVATAALVLAAAAVTIALEFARPHVDRMAQLNFELDLFKTVLAGFVIGALGILIPAVAIETRQRFEQRKESRAAYSKAKTDIDYLKLHLATAHFEKATALVQDAHYAKHQAQLYDDFPEWLDKRYDGQMTPDDWDKMMYARLFRTREILEKNAGSWDGLKPDARIDLLASALPTIDEADPDAIRKLTNTERLAAR